MQKAAVFLPWYIWPIKMHLFNNNNLSFFFLFFFFPHAFFGPYDAFCLQYYWIFFLSRGLVGIGTASYSTVAPTIIADRFDEGKRTTMLSVFYICIPMGRLVFLLAADVPFEILSEQACNLMYPQPWLDRFWHISALVLAKGFVTCLASPNSTDWVYF